MKIIILSAGAGSRFTRRGIVTPKTLLPILNRPVIEHNLTALLDTGNQVIVVGSLQVNSWIKSQSFPGVITVDCPVIQSGPVTSALLASAHINSDDRILILDGDQIYSPNVIPEMLNFSEGQVVVCPLGPNPDWCAVHTEDTTWGEEISFLKEKGNDTKLIVSGGYGFPTWSDFQNLSYKLLAEPSPEEPKLSHVVNLGIEYGIPFKPYRIEPDEWISVGTPEELETLLGKQ